MSTGTPQSITVTSTGTGTATVTPSVLLLTETPVDSVAITWTIDGGTLASSSPFAWIGTAPSSTIPGAPSTTTLDYTFYPPLVPEQGGQVLTFAYSVTLANGDVGTGQLEIASAWAYPDTFSINAGDTLQLHVATNAPFVGMNVYPITAWAYQQGNDGTPNWTTKPLYILAPEAISYSTLAPGNAKNSGVEDWEWPANVSIPTDKSWPTGIYIVQVAAYATQKTTNKTSMTWVLFVVRNPSPAPGARMLYKWNINTIQGYSTALFPSLQDPGGNPQPYDNDLYENPYPPPQPNTAVDFKITFRRPTSSMWDVKSMTYDFEFVKWLQQQNYAVDFCTDVDVEIDTELAMLSNYPVVLFRGHDEYLGAQTYANLINYRNAGGNIVFLSGNTCCWQVHFTDVDPVLNIPTAYTCSKGTQSQLCDVVGPDAWWKQSPGGLDNALVGAGSRNAAIANEFADPYYTAPQPPPFPGVPGYLVAASPGYTVQNADHWIFANTGLTSGFTIGLADIGQDAAGTTIIENLIGYEAAGVRINSSGAMTYIDGTPANFALLGVAITTPTTTVCNKPWPEPPPPMPATGWWWAFTRETGNATDPFAATMGMYSAYGSVFSASTIHWVMILDETDYDGGETLTESWAPSPWNPGKDVNGNPILGNKYVHYITRNVLTAFSNPARGVVAVGDLNGDGNADLVLQSASTGEPSYWLMNGSGGRTAAGSVLYKNGIGAPGATWRIAGIGSLTSATSTELIFQSNADSSLQYWTVDYAAPSWMPSGAATGVCQTAAAALVPIDSPGTEWVLRAVLPAATLPGAYLLFQNTSNGSVYYWELNGTTQGTTGDFVFEASANWSPTADWILVAAIDLNGDGTPDLVFQNTTDGSLEYAIQSGMAATSAGPISGTTPGTVVGAGDFTGAGTPCLLFQDTTTGALTWWTIVDFAEGTSGQFTPSSNPWFLGSP